ncbi:MAG: dienelactone hydrolase [Actinobacteria bacterium]|nr:dienelactone hydrolase [Actinomycetota bacterium]MCG2800738.1 dienelactone hydrolase [Cellulomonas sp.]
MPRPTALLLTPGAGGTADHPALLAVEHAVRPLPVRRTKLPPTPAGAVVAVVERAAAFAAELGTDPAALVVGGRSFGGRMCSMAVAQGLPAAGLVLLSYPLHPPGRRQQLRIEHLAALTLPILAISGERDPYGAPDELRTHLPAGATLRTVPGAHTPADPQLVAAMVADWLATLT